MQAIKIIGKLQSSLYVCKKWTVTPILNKIQCLKSIFIISMKEKDRRPLVALFNNVITRNGNHIYLYFITINVQMKNYC